MHVQYPTELIAVLAVFLGALLIPGALAQTTLQGNDCTAAGAYTLCQNLWGAGEFLYSLCCGSTWANFEMCLQDTGTGSQTTTLRSTNGNSVSWETSYTWANSPDNVKSCESFFLVVRVHGNPFNGTPKTPMLATTPPRACSCKTSPLRRLAGSGTTSLLRVTSERTYHTKYGLVCLNRAR